MLMKHAGLHSVLRDLLANRTLNFRNVAGRIKIVHGSAKFADVSMKTRSCSLGWWVIAIAAYRVWWRLIPGCRMRFKHEYRLVAVVSARIRAERQCRLSGVESGPVGG
jgi:hypothetical protein